MITRAPERGTLRYEEIRQTTSSYDWGGIEKPAAGRATFTSVNWSYLLGYTLGYTETGLRQPEFMASHHGHLAAEPHYPEFAPPRQSACQISPRTARQAFDGKLPLW